MSFLNWIFLNTVNHVIFLKSASRKNRTDMTIFDFCDIDHDRKNCCECYFLQSIAGTVAVHGRVASSSRRDVRYRIGSFDSKDPITQHPRGIPRAPIGTRTFFGTLSCFNFFMIYVLQNVYFHKKQVQNYSKFAQTFLGTLFLVQSCNHSPPLL